MGYGKQNENIEQVRKWIIKQNEFVIVKGLAQLEITRLYFIDQ